MELILGPGNVMPLFFLVRVMSAFVDDNCAVEGTGLFNFKGGIVPQYNLYKQLFVIRFKIVIYM